MRPTTWEGSQEQSGFIVRTPNATCIPLQVMMQLMSLLYQTLIVISFFPTSTFSIAADQPKTKRDVSRAQAEEYIAVEEYEYIAVEEVDSSNEDEVYV